MFSVEINGASDVADGMKYLSTTIRNRIAVEALVVAMTPVLNSARRYAGKTRDTGALQESIGFRVRPYPRLGKVICVIGPRRGFKRKDPSGKGYRDPAKYGHLIEFGHAKRGGAGTVAAVPFMRPAFAENSQRVIAELAAALGQRIEVAVARKKRRAKKKGT